MYACWDLEPEKRISFQDISAALKQFRKGKVTQIIEAWITKVRKSVSWLHLRKRMVLDVDT